jgi:hypothetical protein
MVVLVEMVELEEKVASEELELEELVQEELASEGQELEWAQELQGNRSPNCTSSNDRCCIVTQSHRSCRKKIDLPTCSNNT